MTEHFDADEDNIGNSLDADIVRIARHTAQRLAAPMYHRFAEREEHNLDTLADRVLSMDRVQCDEHLRAEYERRGSLWNTFFKTYERFAMAVDGAVQRQLYERRFGTKPAARSAQPQPRRQRELTEVEKKQVRDRDRNTCRCCGAKGRGVRLEIDHIVPYSMGGETSIQNSQTLCSVCNRQKQINEINFTLTKSQLSAPRQLTLFRDRRDPVRAIIRTVNVFYHCGAVCEIRSHQRSSGRYYDNWEIELYAGNNREWLAAHTQRLLHFIREDLGCPQVRRIRIVGGTSG